MGRSRGGISTKLHALVDGKARPLYVTLTAGQRHESVKADELMDQVQGQIFVADAGYDSDRVRATLRTKGIKAVINNAGLRKRKKRVDKRFYHKRYLIECFFHRIKLFRAVATRYDKTARNYLATVSLACAWVWLN